LGKGAVQEAVSLASLARANFQRPSRLRRSLEDVVWGLRAINGWICWAGADVFGEA
jgi:hypothetical protein